MQPGGTPIAWTIAGSDSGGGAGVQVDLKVFSAFGVHGCSAITALTAQNTLGVRATESVSGTMLHAQLEALAEDLAPAAIKTGMLGSASTCGILSDFLDLLASRPLLICDPVLKSTSGFDLLDRDALAILKTLIFPKVGILTPNLPEVERLIGTDFRTVEEAAERILMLGVGSVLIKGGHAEGEACTDYWTDGTRSLCFSSPRIDTRSTHGTGCILSAALAAALALGKEVPEALATAKTYINQCLKSAAGVGAGRGAMRIEPFRDDPADRPTIR